MLYFHASLRSFAQAVKFISCQLFIFKFHIIYDLNSDVEQEVEVGVAGSVGGSARLTQEIYVKRIKSTTTTSIDTGAKEPQPPVAPEETKKQKQVCASK
jgi:hypothetical protein